MGPFFDLHSHMLCEVDDGAKDQEEMFAMLETAYSDGIRALCLTPHYSPYLFGDTLTSSQKSFEILCDYVHKEHPDMRLFLAHELGYHNGCLEALECGKCRTIAGSRYVLVDFPETVDFFTLSTALNTLRRAGYRTVLAHTERYRALFGKLKWVEEYVDEGGLVQINASSVTGAWGTLAKMQWKKLIHKGLVHVISTDAHNLTTRPPKISDCLPFLQKHCAPEEVECLLWENAWRIVEDLSL